MKILSPSRIRQTGAKSWRNPGVHQMPVACRRTQNTCPRSPRSWQTRPSVFLLQDLPRCASFAPPLLLGPALPLTRLLTPGLRLFCRPWKISPHACMTVVAEAEFSMSAGMVFYVDAGGDLIFERIASKRDSKFLAVDDSHSGSKSSASRPIRTLNIWFDTKTLSNPPRPSNHLPY